jgi:antitoxin component YwqK of YwqJK toxin-antitoxin module
MKQITKNTIQLLDLKGARKIIVTCSIQLSVLPILIFILYNLLTNIEGPNPFIMAAAFMFGAPTLIVGILTYIIADNKLNRKLIYTSLLMLVSFAGQTSKACGCINILTIDSLPQLKEYDFIAYVKIINDQELNKSSKKDFITNGLLTIEILELFKGNKIGQVIENAKNTSCDIGISKGEEWILFGKTINGRIAILACDRNVKYKESDELRDWKYGDGFYQLSQLRKLYQHPVKKYENEKHIELYSNGKKEIEETYVNGKLDGERKIWYPSGVLFCKQFYINDTLDGKSEWFYQSGQIFDEHYYLKGKPCNISRIYYDSTILIDDFYKTEDSLNFLYNRVQPQYEIVFDSYGRAIISREYTQLGKIYKEETINPDRKFSVVIYYHDNGVISSIMYSLNGKNYGHYQTYNENGFPDRGWNYDENGKVIKLEEEH